MTRRIRGPFKADGGVIPVALPLFLSGTLGARAGVASDGVLIGELTPQAVGTFFMLDASGPTYVDDTTDINDADAGDVLVMPATEAAGPEGTGDVAFYGHATKKCTGIKITIATAGVGGVVAWEYWNGTTWVDLSTAHHLLDSSAGYTTGTSTYFITWKAPTNWALKTVNNVSAYWVRSRVTTVYTTNPAVTQAWLLTVHDGIGIYSPTNGVVTRVSFSALTKSGATDSVFQLINLSRGLFAPVTFTQAVAAQKGATVTGGLVVGRGESLVMQQLQSHGTAAANVLAVLDIS